MCIALAVSGYFLYKKKKEVAETATIVTDSGGGHAANPTVLTGSGVIAPTEKPFSWIDYSTWGW